MQLVCLVLPTILCFYVVASFVWSHLKQVLESKDPLKGYMKPLLLETAFAETHDLDPRKYSKYYEASVFSGMKIVFILYKIC